MAEFPRTEVGGISISRMIIGTNWFLGYSHTSMAKDKFIRSYQTSENIADILCVFLEAGVDAVMGLPLPKLNKAIEMAQDRTGKKLIRIMTPIFNLLPGGDAEMEPEKVFDYCASLGTSICMPHQAITDALMDKLNQEIRDIGKYTKMILDRGMVPGVSSHMPEVMRYADNSGAGIETYIQLYNASGFLMQVEVDWVMRMISKAEKPVMTIKPLAAGQLLPPVGLAFVWNTIRDMDMVTIGTTTPDEAREVIDLSLDFLNRRLPDHELHMSRSKTSLVEPLKVVKG